MPVPGTRRTAPTATIAAIAMSTATTRQKVSFRRMDDAPFIEEQEEEDEDVTDIIGDVEDEEES